MTKTWWARRPPMVKWYLVLTGIALVSLGLTMALLVNDVVTPGISFLVSVGLSVVLAALWIPAIRAQNRHNLDEIVRRAEAEEEAGAAESRSTDPARSE